MLRIFLFFIWKGYRRIKDEWKNVYSQKILNIQLYTLGIKCGKNIRTLNSFPILKISRFAKNVEICDNVVFNNLLYTSWYSRTKIIVTKDAEFIIGSNSGMNGCLIYCSNSIIIGQNVDIGGGTRIYDTNFHSLNYRDRRDSFKDKNNTISLPIIIEDDVFIGTNCIIGKGITIGARSIIAAGSVVVKNIPPDELWGGNPAKFIKKIN
jgi:acetyltransferase-like isoleucine patch superfamily enzyme